MPKTKASPRVGGRMPASMLKVVAAAARRCRRWGKHATPHLVVRDPELFESLTNVFETLEPSDVVTAEGKNFEVLQAGKGDHLLDGVG